MVSCMLYYKLTPEKTTRKCWLAQVPKVIPIYPPPLFYLFVNLECGWGRVKMKNILLNKTEHVYKK